MISWWSTCFLELEEIQLKLNYHPIIQFPCLRCPIISSKDQRNPKHFNISETHNTASNECNLICHIGAFWLDFSCWHNMEQICIATAISQPIDTTFLSTNFGARGATHIICQSITRLSDSVIMSVRSQNNRIYPVNCLIYGKKRPTKLII